MITRLTGFCTFLSVASLSVRGYRSQSGLYWLLHGARLLPSRRNSKFRVCHSGCASSEKPCSPARTVRVTVSGAGPPHPPGILPLPPGEGRGLPAALSDCRRAKAAAAQAGEGSASALWQGPHKAKASAGVPEPRGDAVPIRRTAVVPVIAPATPPNQAVRARIHP